VLAELLHAAKTVPEQSTLREIKLVEVQHDKFGAMQRAAQGILDAPDGNDLPSPSSSDRERANKSVSELTSVQHHPETKHMIEPHANRAASH